jgi:hypothetical protein
VDGATLHFIFAIYSQFVACKGFGCCTPKQWPFNFVFEVSFLKLVEFRTKCRCGCDETHFCFKILGCGFGTLLTAGNGGLSCIGLTTVCRIRRVKAL